ncbi:MAG: LUD domain-containing protein [Bacilli bacterium]|nr:LUD domain-containing protein [Bacilli bacterium]
MEQMTGREQVMKSIRNAQIEGKINSIVNNINFDNQIYPSIQTNKNDCEELAIHFAKALDASEGFFIYCENTKELIESIKTIIRERNFSPIFTNDPKIELLFTKSDISYCFDQEELSTAQVVVSFCDALIARYGSVLLSSKTSCGIVGNALPDVRFIIAFPEQLVENLSDAYSVISQKYNNEKPSVLSFISGPSRTNVIEQKSVIGVYGIRELYVFYLNTSD